MSSPKEIQSNYQSDQAILKSLCSTAKDFRILGDIKIFVAKNGVALSERTTLQFNPAKICFQAPDSVKTVINLEWRITGPCPGQWNAYFYNEFDGRTLYIFGKILTGGLHRCFLRVGNILMKNLSDCITNN